MKKMMKSKGMAKGGKRGGVKKKMAKGGMRGGAKKMMRNGGKAMKSKGMAKGGKRGGAMTLAAIRSAAKSKGYKLVKA